MPRRRAIGLATAGVLAVIAGAALWWRSASPGEPGTASAERSVSAQPRSLPRAPADAPLRAAPERRLALASAQDLRQRARYPRSSQPIRDGEEDPIVRDLIVSRSAFPGPNGEDPVLTAFPAQISFEPADAVTLYAYLTVGDHRIAARSIEADLIDDHGRTLAHLRFADDGVDPDRSGDLVYSARVPSSATEGLAGGAYVVRIHAVSAEGDERIGSTGFLFSRPDAALTGRYTDAVVGGNLEIRAEIDVRNAGRFHLAGTLYTPSGTPVAWAQNALTLSPGSQWIPLSFFGLILRERGEDGPYVLRFAALSTTTAMPNAKNRVVENAYTTAPHRATDFSDRPYDDPNLIDAAERLERAGAASAGPSDGGQ